MRRRKLESALKPLLEAHMPTIQAKNAGGEIHRFKEEGPALYAKRIGQYEALLSKKNEAKQLLEKLERGGARKKKGT